MSRAGLHTGPAPVAGPAFTPGDHPSSAVAEAALTDATTRIEQTSRLVVAATRGQLVELLRAAQRDVDRARRTPHAPGALAALDRDYGRLRREVERREREIDAKEDVAGTAQRHAVLQIDRLAAVNLGMGPAVSECERPQYREAGLPTVTSGAGARAQASADGSPRTAPPRSQAHPDIESATEDAERVADRAASASLDELAAAKKAAQRALSATLKTGAPEHQVARLKEALKVIQRAESRMIGEVRSGSTIDPGMRTEVLRDPHVSYKSLKSSTRYKYGNQEYFTDANGLPARARGYLSTTGDKRSYRATEIGRMGEARDVGFHLIARSFGGHPSGPNIVPANVKLNAAGMQAYGSLENTWRTLQGAGARIYVDVNLVGPSTRPSMISIDFWVEVKDQAEFLSRIPEDERENFSSFLTAATTPRSAPNSVAFENVAPD